ncbi:MAG: hypothetical protein ACK5W9_12600, partial [Bdellovibrionales bacterium]
MSHKSHGPLFIFIFTVISLTGGLLFLPQAQASKSARQCLATVVKNSQESERLADQLTKGLSPTAKIFWAELGLELKKHLDHDFQRPANKEIYQEQILLNHPAVAFYKSLGFT